MAQPLSRLPEQVPAASAIRYHVLRAAQLGGNFQSVVRQADSVPSLITLLAPHLNLLDSSIEITFKQAILGDAIFFKFTFGMGLGKFCCDLARILKNLPVPKFQEPAHPVRSSTC